MLSPASRCVVPTEDEADLPALCHPAQVGVPQGAVREVGVGPWPRRRERHFHLHGKVPAPSWAGGPGHQGGGQGPCMLRGLRDLAWPGTLKRAPGWDGFDAGGPVGGIGLGPAGVDCRPAWWGPPQPLDQGTELTASRCTTWGPSPAPWTREPCLEARGGVGCGSVLSPDVRPRGRVCPWLQAGAPAVGIYLLI